MMSRIYEFIKVIKQQYPSMPLTDVKKCAEWSVSNGTGRGTISKEAALNVVRSYIRHCYTNYDELIAASGVPRRRSQKFDEVRHTARAMVRNDISKILINWSKPSQHIVVYNIGSPVVPDANRRTANYGKAFTILENKV